MTTRYAIGEIIPKYAINDFTVENLSLPATMVYGVGIDYSQENQQTWPTTTITYTNTSESNPNLLEKKLKLYENIIEYLMSLLSQEDKEAVKELSELLSRLSH